MNPKIVDWSGKRVWLLTRTEKYPDFEESAR